LNKFVRITLFLVLIPTIILISTFYWLSEGLPDVETIQSIRVLPSIQIVDRNNRLLYEELGENTRRFHPLTFQEIPECLKQATIATEDIRFYSNPGFDLIGITRALWQNITGGEMVAGGSTITQQLVRNLLLAHGESSQRTLTRKLREVILAWKLTNYLSKNEILALYLNHTYYGSFAFGVQAASQTFFGKPASELDLAQCALIAGLPQAPAVYNPFIHPDKAKSRQMIVLERMLAVGFIEKDEFDIASKEPLSFSSSPYPIEAPHFVMMVLNQFDELIEKSVFSEEIRQQSIVIHTTLDLNLQFQAEKIIRSHLSELAKERGGLGHNVHNAALVAIDPRTGEVLTLVGSADYFNDNIDGAINMAINPRQPGSALKPFVYALAMDTSNPTPLTPNSIIWDQLTPFATKDKKTYIPMNYDGKEHGAVTVRQALGSSLNIPAVIVLNFVGLEKFSAFARTVGLDSLKNPEDYDLTVALGGGGVTLLELTEAYSVFANMGVHKEPILIREIRNRNGETLYQSKVSSEKVLDPRIAWLISDILQDDQARWIGFGKNSVLNLDRPAAVKTGTTTNFHDNWTVGYTPQLVTGVWVGNSDYQPMIEVTGLTGAAPIWHHFMRSALNNREEQWFNKPEGVTIVKGCQPLTFFDSSCQREIEDWIINNTKPIILPNKPEHASTISTGQPFTVMTPSEGAVFYLASRKDSHIRLIIQIRNDSDIDHFKIFINNENTATLDRMPYETWLDFQPGEYEIRVEGWRNSALIQTQTVHISVRSSLR
jgi:1A family penicillin-binding protein